MSRSVSGRRYLAAQQGLLRATRCAAPAVRAAPAPEPTAAVVQRQTASARALRLSAAAQPALGGHSSAGGPVYARYNGATTA
ncbi:hypothetical protein [Streptomyces violascens]|uniref:Uncharacterized protein n=1 Tax=Streptomyces violascens TaxID=67381 RepID=A0ABQ3QSC8_9ACTN|nr:hypothetical protein [Streptomyces violascens]GGU50562.1 hypothetical protein GCM10010289_83740 [Streptomyces violascens]GHI40191.1 hypothetical protein Sviol_45990 [Streptomyces violascens]